MISEVNSAFIEFILKEAKNLREIAGQSGMHHDLGASQLEHQVSCYNAGRSNSIPPEWKELHAKFERESDPEYKEFLRLKSKFDR